jgi:peptidoglycan/xylan/chitin deacetylase (PgdA/CDA1 family)/LPS sulfotransferase NodH
MKRIFLVGCPRSGTTILQSLLAAHPEVISFPESKFFHYLLYDKFAEKLPSRLEVFFKDEIQRPEFLASFDRTQNTETQASWFVGVLDSLAAEQNKSIWLEKTPEHIYFIEDIERFLPDVKFIHILRNGMDAIASMYEATRSFHYLWGGVWDLNHCIERWEYAILTSNKYLDKPNHILVKYEQLLDDKVKVLAEICKFIGIDYDAAMLDNYKKQAANLSLNLPWHKGIDRDIASTKSHKYHRLFKQDEIACILDKIELVNQQIAWKAAVEITEPIADICGVQPTFDRLCCTVKLEGTELGIVELPICDEKVPAWVLEDAIAANFAWEILKRFLQQDPENPLSEWTLFLQQIWNRPNWIEAYFYNPKTADEAHTISIDRESIALEISEDLPNIQTKVSEIDVLVKVGGVAIGIVTVPAENNFISAQKLRSTITRNSGFELCVACARSALIGQPLNSEMSLRSRLALSAGKMANLPDWLNAPGSGGIYPSNAAIFGRRSGAIGTSVSRRAVLPAAALREIASAAAVAGEPTIQIPRENELSKQVIYAPEIIWQKASEREVSPVVKFKNFAGNTDTDKLPILAYRCISPDSLNAINTQAFEQQLQYLKNQGYYSASWSDWQRAKRDRTPLPGKAVIITFDGGYMEFFTSVFPLLKRFNFTATVFLVAESVGKTNTWEKAEVAELQLMGWPEIRQLRDAGIEFGSMSATYQPLTALSATEIVREAANSRAILERGLGKSVRCFAYPYGKVDSIVEHLVGAIGYTFGVTYGSNFSSFDNSLMSLPRIQVTAENFWQLGL